MSQSLKSSIAYTTFFVFLHHIVSLIKQPYILTTAMESSVMYGGVGAFLSTNLMIEFLCNIFTIFDDMRKDPSNSFFYDLLMTSIIIFFSLTNTAIFMALLIKKGLFLNSNYLYVYIRLTMTVVCSNFLFMLINRHISNKGLTSGISIIFGLGYIRVIFNRIASSPHAFSCYLASLLFLSVAHLIINSFSRIIFYVSSALLYSDSIKAYSNVIETHIEDRIELSPGKFIIMSNVFIMYFNHTKNFIREYIDVFNIYYAQQLFFILESTRLGSILFYSMLFALNCMYIFTDFKEESIRDTLNSQSCMVLGIPNNSKVSRLLACLVIVNTVVLTIIQIVVSYILIYVSRSSIYTKDIFNNPIECMMLVSTITNMFKQIKVMKISRKPDISRDMNFK